MFYCGSLIKTDSNVYGRVRIRERNGDRWYEVQRACVRYPVMWLNISTEMGRVGSFLS